MLSQGVPMLLGGDEIGRTQNGNNNAYCQDNEISWYDWEHADQELLNFTQRLIRLRHRHPVFCRRRWFQGRPIHGSNVSDIGWFTPAGSEMAEEDWGAGFAKSLGVFLNGRAIPTPNERGEQVIDDSFYAMFNTSHETVEFTLPEAKWGQKWVELLGTAEHGDAMDEERTGDEFGPGAKIPVQAWSLALLRRSA
jgi:glycogen operon protein